MAKCSPLLGCHDCVEGGCARLSAPFSVRALLCLAGYTLSYHPASEVFLQRMMALYVASHYKNQPNDLQLMSDAPAHHLFVLLPPLKDDETHLPEPLVVLQVALEGSISKQVIMDNLSRGIRAGGDMIPWTISQQFQENKFAALSGARVIRIATHPDYAGVSLGDGPFIVLQLTFRRWVMVRGP